MTFSVLESVLDTATAQTIDHFSRGASKYETEELIAQLGQHKEFETFNGVEHTIGPATYQMTFGIFAQWLVSRASFTSSQQAIEDALRYSETGYHDCHAVLALRGIRVDEPVELTKNVRLVPVNLTPSVKVYEPFGYTPFESALVETVTLPNRLANQPPSNIQSTFASMPQKNTAYLALVLGLIKDLAPTKVGDWIAVADSVPQWLGAHAFGRPSDLGPLPEDSPRLLSYDYTYTKETAKLFMALDDEARSRLDMPLQRLNLAKRRSKWSSQSIADKVIDLGISMESLFLSDAGDGGSEIGFKMRVRAAKLIGKSEEERREIYKVFGNLYSMRSSAAHTGKVYRSKKPLDLEQAKLEIEECLEKAKVAIILTAKEVHKTGNWIDWLSIVLR